VGDLCRRGYGPGRIRQYLKEKQLDGPDIDIAMEDYVFLPEKLQAYIDSKLRGQTPDRKALKRVADGLFRRGFSWGTVQSALRDYTDSLELEETP
jgi:SOS response regulatory protein OraA/RecX